MKSIQICTLGKFSLQAGDVVISDNDSRSRKVWSLLACLVCHREQPLSSNRLIELLWGDDSSSNPENVLRITLHRLRTALNRLWDGAGRELILYRDNCYCWNNDIPTTLDCDRFEQLILSKTAQEVQLSHYLEALELYQGEFLPKQASDLWVIPIATHFHNLYVQAVMQAVQMLIHNGRAAEALPFCRSAAAAEPYHEPLHRIWMQALSQTGDRKGAGAVYDALSKRLFDDFGIRPDEETRAVYRACAHSPEDRTLPIDEILEHLQEPDSRNGAMECDYDYFKVLCYAESRALERSGNVTHVALFSVTGTPEHPLSKRTLNRIMEQFGEQLRINLRRGDTISRCSISQYIIMLPSANYENSCMVCRRLLAAFNRAHPHVTARINYMVQPLTPSIRVP